MRMQIQAKLAAGAHQGHMAKHMSKCLHGSATAKPAESCTQLPFGGAILLKGSKIGPPNIWGTNLKLFFWIASFLWLAVEHKGSLIWRTPLVSQWGAAGVAAAVGGNTGKAMHDILFFSLTQVLQFIITSSCPRRPHHQLLRCGYFSIQWFFGRTEAASQKMQCIDAIKSMASLDPCLKNAKWWEPPQNRPSPAQNRPESEYSWIFQDFRNSGKYHVYVVGRMEYGLGKRFCGSIIPRKIDFSYFLQKNCCRAPINPKSTALLWKSFHLHLHCYTLLGRAWRRYLQRECGCAVPIWGEFCDQTRFKSEVGSAQPHSLRKYRSLMHKTRRTFHYGKTKMLKISLCACLFVCLFVCLLE